MTTRVWGAAVAGAIAYPLFWAGLTVVGVGPPLSDADPYGALAFAGLGILLVAAACGGNWLILRRFHVTRPWLVAAAGGAVALGPWVVFQIVIGFFSEAVWDSSGTPPNVVAVSEAVTVLALITSTVAWGAAGWAVMALSLGTAADKR